MATYSMGPVTVPTDVVVPVITKTTTVAPPEGTGAGTGSSPTTGQIWPL